MRLGDLELTPFVLGMPRFTASWAERSPIEGTVFIDVLMEENLPFFRLLNAANNAAYGKAGMPDWVQFDLANLPTAMVGFALERHAVPPDVWSRIREAWTTRWPEDAVLADGYQGLVPIAEWCASHTPEPGTVVGFSMFSLLRGRKIAVRAKALGLLLMGARLQVGIGRRSGHVRWAHETFGELRVLRDRPAPHPLADESIVYELDVPPAGVLEQIVRTGRAPAP